jgi:DNA modification methylase
MIRGNGYWLFSGEAARVLGQIPKNSVQCVVTSPPYWMARDYKVENQLGLEKTPKAYIERLVDIMGAIKQILRPDGCVFLNLGDGYARQAGAVTGTKHKTGQGKVARAGAYPKGPLTPPPGLKEKDLLGMPWRVALALQEDGWWLRSEIIWWSPNKMPENAKDRPNRAHEHLFLLTKNQRYFYDRTNAGTGIPGIESPSKFDLSRMEVGSHSTVWRIPRRNRPRPKQIHFATMPEELAEACIIHGSPNQGCCSGCGAPATPIGFSEPLGAKCKCPREKPSTGAIVLDPFMGSGTTGFVALQMRRRFVGVDIKQEYVDLTQERLENFLCPPKSKKAATKRKRKKKG